MPSKSQNEMLDDARAAYDWAFGVILEDRLPTKRVNVDNDGDHRLWRCSICREQVSRHAVEMVNGSPVCWGCIDEKMLGF